MAEYMTICFPKQKISGSIIMRPMRALDCTRQINAKYNEFERLILGADKENYYR